MLRQSFGSVEVFWLDRDAVLQAAKKSVRRLTRAHPEVVKVVLFGSMARGDAVPGSDVDLLMVLTSNHKTFLERSAEYHPEGIPVGVDVFAYTEDELARMLREGNTFVKQAFAEGLVIYQRHTP